MIVRISFHFFILLTIIGLAMADMVEYVVCQTGCNKQMVVFYGAAVFVFGNVSGGNKTPSVIIACNAALGTCMAACIAAGFAPTPQPSI